MCYSLSLLMVFFIGVVNPSVSTPAFFSFSSTQENVNYTCPGRVSSPCFCSDLHPLPYIQCSNANNLYVILRALEALPRERIPWLKLTDSVIFRLPPATFSNIAVTRLQISSSTVRYISDKAFVGMEDVLESLELKDDHLFEVPKTALERLGKLATLSLSGNLLSKLEQDSFSGQLILKHLILNNNFISTIEHGTFPAGLRTLTLSNNHLLTLNNTVTQLKQLEWLFVADNSITSVEKELQGLDNLLLLNLAGNSIRELGNSLDDLHNLQFLNLEDNDLSEVGQSFKNLVNLERLNLSNNDLFVIERSAFDNLSNLQQLDLSRNHLLTLNGALHPLTSLLFLNISSNNLFSINPKEFKYLVNIKEIDLSNNFLYHLDVFYNYPGLPLESLLLRHNQIESMNGILSHLNKLEELDVSFNKIKAFSKRDFAFNPNLEYIDLQGNPLLCSRQQAHLLADLKSRDVEIDGIPECLDS